LFCRLEVHILKFCRAARKSTRCALEQNNYNPSVSATSFSRRSAWNKIALMISFSATVSLSAVWSGKLCCSGHTAAYTSPNLYDFKLNVKFNTSLSFSGWYRTLSSMNSVSRQLIVQRSLGSNYVCVAICSDHPPDIHHVRCGTSG
jgi:hypothetical protein